MRVLIAEDNRKLAASLRKGLEQEGYSVDCTYNGNDAEALVKRSPGVYDLLILDIMLPGRDGVQVCRNIRRGHLSLPVIMLTARDAVEDRISGLDSGADDYLTKPFSFGELTARIRALLRRPGQTTPMVLEVGPITLDPAARVVRVSGTEVTLTLKEFKLLELLMRNSNQVLSREQIVDKLWDFDADPYSNVVDVHVKNLRKKLFGATNGQVIETIRGVGYRLKA